MSQTDLSHAHQAFSERQSRKRFPPICACYCVDEGHKASLIARGRYMVEDAVQCQNCHTPRKEKGEFIKGQWLRGAKFLPDTLLKERPTWADRSANIAGLPGWTDEKAVKFLMTGLGYNDPPARPPMPPCRFNHEDAEAIVAYLRLLATHDK